MLRIVSGGMHLHHCDFLRIGRFPQTDKSSCVLCFIVRRALLWACPELIPCAKNDVGVGQILTVYSFSGNMMTNVATLMARVYVPFPESAGCQFQAFLIQMLVSPQSPK